MLALALLMACSGPSHGGRHTAASDETVRVGTLRSGFAGIGGEHTGWVLEDADGGAVEVDVAAVRREATRLAGAPVRIRGRLTTRRYVERGPTAVLVAESMTPR